MGYKDEKIVRVLLDEASNVEERCKGYREELTDALAEIIQKERAHIFQRSNIKIEVADIIGRVGTFFQMREKRNETAKCTF